MSEAAARRRFEGQGVLITGASRGLGAATALGFGREGAHVVVGYHRNEARAQEVAAAIAEAGGEATPVHLDVSSRESVVAALEDLKGAEVEVDVLVNNAAIHRDGWVATMDEADFREVLDVNLTGAFLCSRLVVQAMMARRRGAIVNVGSIAGHRASPGQVNYAASKGGLIAMTRTMAAELAPRGVRVNAVVPGLVEVGMGRRLDHRVARQRREAVPLGRFGDAEEVVAAILFMASSAASYVVGHALVVDGGLGL